MACVYVVTSKGPYRTTKHRKLSVARKAAKTRGGRVQKMCGAPGSRTLTDVRGVRGARRRKKR